MKIFLLSLSIVIAGCATFHSPRFKAGDCYYYCNQYYVNFNTQTFTIEHEKCNVAESYGVFTVLDRDKNHYYVQQEDSLKGTVRTYIEDIPNIDRIAFDIKCGWETGR